MKTSIYIFLLEVCIITITTYNAHGQAGSLDPAFGTDGKLTTDFGSANDYGYAVAIQSDDKIVMAGFSNNDFALARYESDGTLDNTFDSDGKVTTGFGGDAASAYATAIQPDGKIVAAGYMNTGTDNYFAVARYHTDGTLDNTFDGDGKVTTDFGDGYESGNSVVIQSDGKIVVAGSNSSDVIIARYNADGSLDTTFDHDGKVMTDIGTYDFAVAAALQGDNKIVIAGYTGDGSDYDLMLIRYNPDGSLDNSFDEDGIAIRNYGYDIINSLVIQDDGKIIAAGQSTVDYFGYYILFRYNTDGTLDNSFGVNGMVLTPGTGTSLAGSCVRLQDDGKIVLGGSTWDLGHFDFALLRYNNDGSVDSTFDGDGIASIDFASDEDYGISVAVQSGGKIVLAGYSSDSSDYDFAVARFNGLEVATAVNDAEENKIVVAANPFGNELVIEGTKENEDILIFDVSGKKLIEQNAAGTETRVATATLPPGPYILTCIDGNKTSNVELIKY